MLERLTHGAEKSLRQNYLVQIHGLSREISEVFVDNNNTTLVEAFTRWLFGGRHCASMESNQQD
jgi:hypothetical protein